MHDHPHDHAHDYDDPILAQAAAHGHDLLHPVEPGPDEPTVTMVMTEAQWDAVFRVLGDHRTAVEHGPLGDDPDAVARNQQIVSIIFRFANFPESTNIAGVDGP